MGEVPAERPELGPCRLWTSAIRKRSGYGAFTFERRSVPAHRMAWFLVHGEWPTDQLNHLCRVRHCVNVDHLEDVTCRANLLDSPLTLAAINVARTACPKGHPKVDVRGARICTICMADRCRERYRAKHGVTHYRCRRIEGAH